MYKLQTDQTATPGSSARSSDKVAENCEIWMVELHGLMSAILSDSFLSDTSGSP